MCSWGTDFCLAQPVALGQFSWWCLCSVSSILGPQEQEEQVCAVAWPSCGTGRDSGTLWPNLLRWKKNCIAAFLILEEYSQPVEMGRSFWSQPVASEPPSASWVPVITLGRAESPSRISAAVCLHPPATGSDLHWATRQSPLGMGNRFTRLWNLTLLFQRECNMESIMFLEKRLWRSAPVLSMPCYNPISFSEVYTHFSSNAPLILL